VGLTHWLQALVGCSRITAKALAAPTELSHPTVEVEHGRLVGCEATASESVGRCPHHSSRGTFEPCTVLPLLQPPWPCASGGTKIRC
jgi:hypothetical protein